ncbi:hypothetical protein CYMTET_52921 [Cymbomonas tetramitiformis]|uniref:J domain-containing protein n=1 Tax=Cymbomonas tetramitiformis TaxID=36881 RepID=A0AAE0BJD0_9CHLO|nr:hypothetical protein CYMTET_52921 [Cymbomonas tetramitiformis]
MGEELNELVRQILRDRENAYRVLSVDTKCSISEIRSAYKKLAFALHPDRGHNFALAEEAFKVVSAAFAQLQETQASFASSRNFGAGGQGSSAAAYTASAPEEVREAARNVWSGANATSRRTSASDWTSVLHEDWPRFTPQEEANPASTSVTWTEWADLKKPHSCEFTYTVEDRYKSAKETWGKATTSRTAKTFTQQEPVAVRRSKVILSDSDEEKKDEAREDKGYDVEKQLSSEEVSPSKQGFAQAPESYGPHYAIPSIDANPHNVGSHLHARAAKFRFRGRSKFSRKTKGTVSTKTKKVVANSVQKSSSLSTKGLMCLLQMK